MKLQSNITGEIKDWNFSEWLHYIIHSEGKSGEACDVKEFTERVEKFKDEWVDFKEFWHICSDGNVTLMQLGQYYDMTVDTYKRIGNYFETREEAEKAVEKLKALKRLKDKGFKFTGWEESPTEDDSDTIFFITKNRALDDETQDSLTLLFEGEE